MRINELVRLNIAATKDLAFFCVLLLIGQLLGPLRVFAEDISCTAEQTVMPAITVVWDNGVDNYFSAGSVPGYTINKDCPSGCCWMAETTFVDQKYYVDGSAWVSGQMLPEGAHTALLTFTATNGSLDPAVYRAVPYSAPKSFYTDIAPPTIAFTKPENNTSISTADVSVAGNISDAGSGLAIVDVNFSVVSGPCEVRADISNADVASGGFGRKYCNHEYYLSAPALCHMDLSTLGGAILPYDLRDYVNFPEGQDCAFYLGATATDRVGNSMGAPASVSFIVDQAVPVIQISNIPTTYPTPTTKIAGTATDASAIKYMEFKLEQTDYSNTKTYWNGTDWVDDASIIVSIDIPQGKNSFYWSYSGLTPKDIAAEKGQVFTFDL